MLRIVISVLVLCATSLMALAATSDIVRNATNGFIIPGYEQFAGEADLQASITHQLCLNPGVDQLDAARNQFQALVISWSRMEIIRFGPVVTNNRLERILFWPDRKSTGLKQVQAAIANKDATAISVETLRQKSVAMQGLGALEFALFGTGSEDLASADGAYRCAYARTIAQSLNVTGNEIVNDWLTPDGIAEHLSAPQPDYADYRNEAEVLQELVGIFVHGAELIRDTRIVPFVGQGTRAPNHKAALFWRSGATFAAIRANVEGLRDLLIISDIASSLPNDARWATGSFAFEMENFIRVAGEMTQPVDEALADADTLTKINYLTILTLSMQRIAVGQIASELGLSVGFSALDGD